MKSQSQYATKVLAGLLVTSALILSACGAVKSGFKSDPLSGNDRYQEMRKDGVPQTQAVPGEGQTAAPTTAAPVTTDEQPPVTTTGAAPKVPSVVLPDAPATTKIVQLKLKIAEIALPETQVVNFVEGVPVRFEITIENSKGSAQVEGLQDGLKLTPLTGDQYELVWTAPVGWVNSKGLNSYPIAIKTAENRQYSLAIAVSLTNDVPMVRKVDLNSAQIALGEAVGFDVYVSVKKNVDGTALILGIDNEDSASQGEQNVVDAAVMTKAVLQADGTYLLHGVLDTKKLAAADMKAPKLSFYVSATIDKKSSAQISQEVLVNPKVADTAKKDSTTTKKAVVTKKTTTKKTVK